MYDLTTQVTGSAQNIYAGTVELATFTATADCVLSPAVRLSALANSAANLTVGYRHKTSGSAAIGEWVEQFVKPQATSTTATCQVPLVRLANGEKLVVTAKSSNSGDTAAAFAIDWPGELLAVVTVPSASDVATEVASTLATAHGAGSWATATSVTVSDKTGFKLASDGIDAAAAGVRSAVGLSSANLDTQLGALPTAAENADAVWDEDTASHTTAGSFGKLVGTTWAALFSGITSLANWLRALTRSSTPDATALSEINTGGGTYAVATDSLEAGGTTRASLSAYGPGDGDTAVDHDTGGADTLRYTYGGVGIDNGTIRAYLKSDYDAGTYTLRGQTVTGSDGRWAKPMYLNSGLTYTLTFEKAGAYGVTEQEVTIP